MATAETIPATGHIATLADLLDRLGGIDPARIRFHPYPGTATEDDVLAVLDRENVPCELVDGVLVEKAMGYGEAMLALALGSVLRAFVNEHNLGIATGADGFLRLFPGLVRGPDVAFVAWARFPGGERPKDAFPRVAPDLAVEILSPSNTRAEMARKRREYFAAGVQLVWEVDPETRTVAVYRGPEGPTILDDAATLDGGDVLPGFALPLAGLFAELDRKGP